MCMVCYSIFIIVSCIVWEKAAKRIGRQAGRRASGQMNFLVWIWIWIRFGLWICKY